MSKKTLFKQLKLLRKKTAKKPFAEALILLAIFVLVILLATLFVEEFYKGDVASLLPDKKTTAFVELRDFSLPTKAYASGTFNPSLLQNFAKDILDIDYSKASSVLDAPVGAAFIESGSSKNDLVLFARVKRSTSALNYLKSLSLKSDQVIALTEGDSPIYAFKEGLSWKFTLIYPYLVVSQAQEPLETLISVKNGELSSLNESEDFAVAFSNLPRQIWGRLYVNIKQLSLPSENPLMNFIEPLKIIGDRFAMTIRKDHEGFKFNQYMNLNSQYLKERIGYSDDEPFAYALTNYVSSKNLAFYVGGANLSDEWQNTLETLGQLNPAYGILLEGMVRAKVNEVFGSGVDLRNDIYPLFEGEYAFSVNSSKGGIASIKLILAHSDREFVTAKLKKLYDGFRFLAAQFVPEVQVFVLPDGTESRELVADTDRVIESSDSYEGFDINCVEVKDSLLGFCYTVTDDLIIMANKRDSIKESIDLSFSPEDVLSESRPFRQALSNLSQVSDEITHIQVDETLSLFEAKPIGQFISGFVSPFESITWVKHYFDDGVSSEGYLLLK